jgi:Tfp pilus assembly protein PilV
MTPLALNGFKDSAALVLQFLQKGMEALQASIKAIDANRYSEASQSNRKAEYFKALAGMATIHEGIFLDGFNTLLLNSPATARNALFEQAVKTYPLIQRPGAMTALAQALHTAYKEEDNADNKKRMDSWLTEYKIPEVEATPTTTQTTKY